MSVTQSVLNAQLRGPAERGKGPNNRLRASGRIPAVIYGKGSESVSLAIDPKSLRKAINTPRKLNTVITVRFDGENTPGDKMVLVKETQRHPITGNLLHADFQEVQLDTEVTVQVPVVLSGRAQGVVDGGLLTQTSRITDVVCTPDHIPAQITVDIRPMKIGDTIHESDLVLPEGVRLAYPQLNVAIATISAQEAEEESKGEGK